MLVLQDWRRLVWWPGIALTLTLTLLLAGGFDRAIAQALFYSESSGWLGAGAGDWWAHRLIHGAGRWMVRGIAAAAIVSFAASFFVARLRPWRRELTYLVVGLIAVIAIAGLLKRVTNIDCPWSLAGFGGEYPYVSIFGDRPDDLPPAACFPGAHSSSGFALMAFFFALRNRARRAARVALALSLVVGVTFAIGQEARGAHFLSHDLASATLAWALLVGLYSRMLGSAAGATAGAALTPAATAWPGSTPASP